MSPTMSDESQSFFGDVLQWQMQDSSDMSEFVICILFLGHMAVIRAFMKESSLLALPCDHFKRIAVESVEKQILSFHVIFALSLSCYH